MFKYTYTYISLHDHTDGISLHAYKIYNLY